MNFGQALEYLKEGHKVARAGWNGKDMYIYLVSGIKMDYGNLRGEADKPLNDGKPVVINSHIDMQAADGSIVVGWLASQTDMLAEDWEGVL